nr:hypothetical protein [uncultured Selenomonas sp.]
MVFLDQYENVINIDFNLFNQLDLKDNIIRDVGTLSAFTATIPLVL